MRTTSDSLSSSDHILTDLYGLIAWDLNMKGFYGYEYSIVMA